VEPRTGMQADPAIDLVPERSTLVGAETHDVRIVFVGLGHRDAAIAALALRFDVVHDDAQFGDGLLAVASTGTKVCVAQRGKCPLHDLSHIQDCHLSAGLHFVDAKHPLVSGN
jgi:hypothetical protein